MSFKEGTKVVTTRYLSQFGRRFISYFDIEVGHHGTILKLDDVEGSVSIQMSFDDDKVRVEKFSFMELASHFERYEPHKQIQMPSSLKKWVEQTEPYLKNTV